MRSDVIVFVWCEQARRQDDVRWRFSQPGDRLVGRFRKHHVDVQRFFDEPLENYTSFPVRFDCEYLRHGPPELTRGNSRAARELDETLVFGGDLNLVSAEVCPGAD
jgi:hypothetical protein